MAAPDLADPGRADPRLAAPATAPAPSSAPGSAGPALRRPVAELAARLRPSTLAGDDLLAADEALAGLLGGPGLRRGSTVVVDGAAGAGATSLLLRLLAAPTTAGAWCALVGLPTAGIVAAEELGVALDRLLLVPEPGGRLAAVVAALLEGCDLVVAHPGGAVSPREAARLSARARERRAVLVAASAAVGAAGVDPEPVARRGGWPGTADVVLESLAASWVGIGTGTGRLVAHGIEVLARHPRHAPGAPRQLLWLQEHPGTTTPDGPALDGRMPTGGRLLGQATG